MELPPQDHQSDRTEATLIDSLQPPPPEHLKRGSDRDHLSDREVAMVTVDNESPL